jgi:hypothetical protein
VSTAAQISVEFSEAMAAGSLTGATFKLEQGGAAVPGTVTYFNETAMFSPAADLALDATYTATVTAGATDLAGNALAAQTWSFQTDALPYVGPAPVRLGAAANFVILANAAISNVPTSAVVGNVGLSPAAASYITGFSLTKAGNAWSSTQVTGGVFAADNDPPTPIDLTTAVGDMRAAYTDAAGRLTPAFLDLGAGTIGGLTLAPGLYKWNSTVNVSTDVTLAGGPNDVWIFQVSGDLKVSTAKSMLLSGGATAKNVFWQVAGFVELGATSHTEGILLSKTAITLDTGASVNGRLFAQTAVAIAGSAVAAPK